MKRTTQFIACCFLLLLFACEKEPLFEKTRKEETSFTVAKIAAAPSINSVTSSEVGIQPPYSSATPAYLGVDADGQTIVTINGANFGSTTGTVAFLGVSSYITTNIISWTNTQIRVRARSYANNLSSVPSTAASVRVNTFGTTQIPSQSVSYAIRVVPTIYSRCYGQCTWHASKRRMETGRTIQPRGLSYTGTGISGNINAYYVPKAGDIYIWPSQHQAYVENVVETVGPISTLPNNAYTYTMTYNLSISEFNATPAGAQSYGTYNNTVRVRVDQANGVITKTIISGSFRSNMIAQATKYYR
jgi:hypothetical protein